VAFLFYEIVISKKFTTEKSKKVMRGGILSGVEVPYNIWIYIFLEEIREIRVEQKRFFATLKITS